MYDRRSVKRDIETRGWNHEDESNYVFSLTYKIDHAGEGCGGEWTHRTGRLLS